MNFMQFVLRAFIFFGRKGYCLTQDVNEASDLFDCLSRYWWRWWW